jgi:hypothetical protein
VEFALLLRCNIEHCLAELAVVIVLLFTRATEQIVREGVMMYVLV